jgi:hypothetical protein
VHDAPPLAPDAGVHASRKRHGRGLDTAAYVARSPSPKVALDLPGDDRAGKGRASDDRSVPSWERGNPYQWREGRAPNTR